MKKKKLRDKNKNNSEFNSNEGDVNEVDDQCKKMKTKKKATADIGESPNPALSGSSKPKRVTFSDQVDKKPDKKIKLAVFDYIESHGLGDEGRDMVLHCRSHPEIRDYWKEIGTALPQMPHVSVYTRAHILLERGKNREWTPEDKPGSACGASQDLRKSKHGMLRDNSGWETIGDKLTTRSSAVCCTKWYYKLTSPMVANGPMCETCIFLTTNDYRLVNALFTLDACCMEEVDWDNLLEHRPGNVCRKWWNQMVQYIGEHGGKSFAEQVEILAKRFCPDLLEVREAFDAKPVIC
ncbi:hypothetical protein HKD37_17G048902 [Glycine soja]